MSNKKGRVLLSFVFCLASATAVFALQQDGGFLGEPKPESEPNEILVALYGEGEPSTPDRVLERLRFSGATSARRLLRVPAKRGILDHTYVLELPEGADLEATIKQLRTREDVRIAEPNRTFQICVTPNDPYYATSGTWGQAYLDLYGLHKIGLTPVGTGTSAWDYAKGDTGDFVVAVIDTGLDMNHPDIVAQLWVNPGEIPGTGEDDDGNGFIDDVHGWNFIDDNNHPHDGHGHGTHCAGTIGATTNNGLGLAGVNWNVRIMPLRGLNNYGSGTTEGLCEAIVYAADNGARVLSNSWGGTGTAVILEEAVQYAVGKGCLVIAAAGNADSDVLLNQFIPAGYPEVMAVAATDPSDVRAWFSNYGTGVEVSAPGVDILSLRAEGTDMYGDGTRVVGEYYFRANGTSMACPHAAGAAALLWALHPDWTAEQVRSRLRQTSDNIDALNDERFAGRLGTGRINVFKAVTMEPGPHLSVRFMRVLDEGSPSENGRFDPGEGAPFVFGIGNIWETAENLSITLQTEDPYLSFSDATASFGTLAEGEVRDNSADPFVGRILSSAPYGHICEVTLEVTATGYSAEFPFRFEVGSPDLRVVSLKWGDSAGDGDGFLEPGEKADLIVSIRNAARGCMAANVILSVTSEDPRFGIQQGTINLGNIRNGKTSSTENQPLLIELDSSLPPGESVPFSIRISDSHGYTTEQIVVVNPPGKKSVLWQQYFNDPWGDINLSPPSACVGPDGSVHMAWQGMGTSTLFLGYGHWAGGAWLLTDRIIHNNDWVMEPKILLDSDGNPQCAFVKTSDDASWWGESTGVFQSVRDGFWPRPAGMNDGRREGYVHRVSLIRDDLDRIHCIWMRAPDYTNTILMYHAIRTGSQWSNPVHVSTLTGNMGAADHISIAPIGGGNLGMVWVSGNHLELYTRRYENGVWSAIGTIPTGASYLGAVNLAVDKNGAWHLAFGDYGTQSRHYMNNTGGTWGPKQTLRTNMMRGEGPFIRKGPQGELYLFYSQDYDIFMRTWRDGILSEERKIFTLTGSYFMTLDFVVDLRGNIHFFSNQRQIGNDIFSINHMIFQSELDPPGKAMNIEAR